MRGTTGKCPGCDATGTVAEPCDERGCTKRGLHFISEAHWKRAHPDDGGTPDPVIGQMVGDFLVVGLIGAGGFGKVYLAFQTPLLRLKGALKLIDVSTDNPEFSRVLLEKFQSEAEVLAHLTHPNIVRLLKYGLHAKRPYLVMEYVDAGRTLRQEIHARTVDGHGFSTDEILAIFDQVLNGLGAAHQESIIHRDIKPENIMLQSVVGNPFHTRLLDFGLAKFIEHHGDTRWHMGSPNYMAPEQVSRKNLGPWTDLYAVTVIIFELLSGRRPFPGSSDEEVLVKKVKEDYDPLDEIADLNFPKPAIEFLATGLQRDPQQRYGDVDALRAALVPAVQSLSDRLGSTGVTLDAKTAQLDSGDIMELEAPNEAAGGVDKRPPSDQKTEHRAEHTSTRGRGRSKLWVVALLVIASGAALVGLYRSQIVPDSTAQQQEASGADKGLAASGNEQPLEVLAHLDTGGDASASDADQSDTDIDADSGADAGDSGDSGDADDDAQAPGAARMVQQMALGKFHTCILLRGGDVRCWGANFDAELGLGHRRRIGDDEPASAGPLVELGEPAIALTAAGDHDASFTCALLESRNIRCWGSNHFGQLGLGRNVARIGEDELPAEVDPVAVGGPVKLLTSGAMQYATHACALLESGDLRCWGNNRYGQLGLGHTRHIGRAQVPANVNPVDVGGDVIELGAGKFHTCALLDGGALRCWGRNHVGQLGYGHTDNIGDDELPGEVDAIDVGEPVEAVSVGRAHTCALLSGGRARCWGWNKYGQLGYGHTDDIGDDEAPAAGGDIDVGSAIVDISAGGLHTCALLEQGRVRCWGDNRFGQLGYGHRESIGDEEPPSRANDVYLGGRAVAIEASNYHSCALLEDDTLRCWGFNDYGQLGYGHTDHIGDNEAPASAGPVPAFDPQQRHEISEK